VENIITPIRPTGGQPPRGRRFWGSVLFVLLLGAVPAGIFLYKMQPAPVLPPEIREVVKKVPVPVLPKLPELAKPPPLPTPPPAAAPAPTPPPQAVLVAKPLAWEGVWHPAPKQGKAQAQALPMFELKFLNGWAVGRFSPNAGTVLNFAGGRVFGDKVEFEVTDQVRRVHVRMNLTGKDKSNFEGRVTRSDWLESVSRLNKLAKTAAQRVVARAMLEEDFKTYHKPKSLGVFIRDAEEGD
jgi:hypothetical protein